MSPRKRLHCHVFTALCVAGLLLSWAPVTLASDPPLMLRATNWFGAPGCDFVDGSVKFDNDSGTYWYKIQVTAGFQVNGVECEGCDMEGTECKCSFDGRTEIIAPDMVDEEFGCELPICSRTECSVHCDNEDCWNPTHCTSRWGPSFFIYKQWSTNGVDWTDFEGTYTVTISDQEESGKCP